MTLTLIKTYKGTDVATESVSFNDVDDYMHFMKGYGINISLQDASFDMQQKQVRFHVPIPSIEIQ